MMKAKDESKNQKFELAEARGYKVIKSNDLIQKSRFQLSTQEQKIILYLISKITPDDVELKEHDFEIREFYKICGIKEIDGSAYKYLKQNLQKLRDRSFWVAQEDGSETLFSWLDWVTINQKSGTVIIKLNEKMKPYLLELKSKFTQYELIHTLAMRSQYAIRLYEILKSYEYKQRWLITTDELKRLLSAENYERYADFKRRVLNIAVREINDLSDIFVSYKPIKSSRKYVKIEFEIKPKESQEQTTAWVKRTKRLDRIN